MIKMVGKVIYNAVEIQSCIDQQHFVEVWVGEDYEICRLIGYDEGVVKTDEGFYYIRHNIILIECTNSNDILH
jgi:hypothetical protein